VLVLGVFLCPFTVSPETALRARQAAIMVALALIAFATRILKRPVAFFGCSLLLLTPEPSARPGQFLQVTAPLLC
jgi:hypothetical protein